MEERKILKTRRRDATSLQRRDRLQRGRDVILLIQKQISLQYNSVCFLYLKNGSFFASILIIFRLIVQTSKHQLYSNRVPHQIQSGTCGLYFREVMILIPNRRSVEIIRMRIQHRWRLLDREEFEHANDSFQGRTLQIQTWDSQEIRLNCRFKESWLSLWMRFSLPVCPSAGTATWEWWWPTSCSACGKTSVRLPAHVSDICCSTLQPAGGAAAAARWSARVSFS